MDVAQLMSVSLCVLRVWVARLKLNSKLRPCVGFKKWKSVVHSRRTGIKMTRPRTQLIYEHIFEIRSTVAVEFVAPLFVNSTFTTKAFTPQ